MFATRVHGVINRVVVMERARRDGCKGILRFNFQFNLKGVFYAGISKHRYPARININMIPRSDVIFITVRVPRG